MAILADSDTRVMVQGITGREAATFTAESIHYGTRIVAGVTPGKGGSKVHDVPVFDTVAEALRGYPCGATIISVPPRAVRAAAWEALDSGLRLLVVVTERIPRRDVVAIFGVRPRQRGASDWPQQLGGDLATPISNRDVRRVCGRRPAGLFAWLRRHRLAQRRHDDGDRQPPHAVGHWTKYLHKYRRRPYCRIDFRGPVAALRGRC